MKPPAVLAGPVLFLAVMSSVLVTDAAAPTGRYMISGGTVYDVKTLLTWQQTASGSTMTHANAVNYCASPWRLPTMKELVTIVDPSSTGPALDSTAFPGSAGLSYFWSSTAVVGSSGAFWYVEFGGGTASPGAPTGTYYVRCVH